MISQAAIDADFLCDYLTSQRLVLATAESCTAGTIIASLSDIEGCGSFVDCSFVTYSRESKQRLLNVQSSTIDTFTLSSEEVAREMATGALRNSFANVAVATTGVAGPEPMDGVPPGVVCVAWAFKVPDAIDVVLFSKTIRIQGDRQQIRKQASNFAINGIIHFHRLLPEGNTGRSF